MSRKKRPSDPAKSPAKRLAIDPRDVPNLGRTWTRGDVDRFRRERPDWLLDARARYRDANIQRKRDQIESAEDALISGGFTPDETDSANAYLTADTARLTVLREFPEEIAEEVVWRWWPEAGMWD